MADYGVVLVTTDTQATAQAIAQALVERRLAACVNLFPISSVYRWEGAIQQEQEWQLIIKTGLNRVAAIEAALHDLHPYEVPEILVLPVASGSQSYLSWLGQQVQPDADGAAE